MATQLIRSSPPDSRASRGRLEFAFLIPTKFYDDVVLEFSPDFEHDSAVFLRIH
jgi:hypothetical protein